MSKLRYSLLGVLHHSLQLIIWKPKATFVVTGLGIFVVLLIDSTDRWFTIPLFMATWLFIYHMCSQD